MPRKPRQQQYLIAIDPGDVHVGWAEFEKVKEQWACVLTEEYTPDQAMEIYHTLVTMSAVAETTVIEEFRLYPDRAMQQTGSTMPTAELIGRFKQVITQATDATELVMQPAAIKKPTIALMKKLDIKHRAVREHKGGHAKDAETHGWYHILRTLEEEPRAKGN